MKRKYWWKFLKPSTFIFLWDWRGNENGALFIYDEHRWTKARKMFCQTKCWFTKNTGITVILWGIKVTKNYDSLNADAFFSDSEQLVRHFTCHSSHNRVHDIDIFGTGCSCLHKLANSLCSGETVSLTPVHSRYSRVGLHNPWPRNWPGRSPSLTKTVEWIFAWCRYLYNIME